MNQFIESNVANLAVVWVFLFLLLKTPASSIVSSYIRSERSRKSQLETQFSESKSGWVKSRNEDKKSTEFVKVSRIALVNASWPIVGDYALPVKIESRLCVGPKLSELLKQIN
jgi:hypothetical protein